MATAAAADAANPSPAGLIADINSIEKRVQGSVKTFTDINNLMERLFRNPDVNFTSEDVPDKFQDFLTSLNRSAKEIGNLRADFRRLADNANTMLKRSTAQACVAPEAALVLENVMRWADSTAAEGRRADSTAAEGRRADEAAEEDDEDDEDEEQGARERGRGGHAVQGSEAETAVGHAQEQSDTPLLSSVVAAPGSYCFGGEFTDHSLAEDAERSEEIPSVLCRGLRGGSAVAEPPLAFAEDLRTSTSSRVTKSVSGFL